MYCAWKRVPWNLVLDGSVAANHIFARSGLIRKDRLVQHAGEYIPPTAIGTRGMPRSEVEAMLADLRSRADLAGAPFHGWILKPAGASNAQGILVAEGDGDVVCALHDERAAREMFVVQPLIVPSLFRGFKFGLRVLFLVAGEGRAFAYADVRALVATTPYSNVSGAMPLSEVRWAHLTNRGLQSQHPSYREAAQNVSAVTVLGEVAFARVFAKCCDILSAAFASLTRRSPSGTPARAPPTRRDLFLLPNTFELFGADFLLDAAFRTWLLEVNADPALGMFYSCAGDGGDAGIRDSECEGLSHAAAQASLALRALQREFRAGAEGLHCSPVWRRCEHALFLSYLLGDDPLRHVPDHWICLDTRSKHCVERDFDLASPAPEPEVSDQPL